MWQDAFEAYVKADTAVKALIGSRFYAGTAPQTSPYPKAIYFGISQEVLEDLGGDRELEKPRIQIDCLAATIRDARAVAKAIKARLQVWGGAADDRIMLRWHLDNEQEDFPDPVDASEAGICRVIQDWIIEHEPLTV